MQLLGDGHRDEQDPWNITAMARSHFASKLFEEAHYGTPVPLTENCIHNIN